jgi:hypothetical protein
MKRIIVLLSLTALLAAAAAAEEVRLRYSNGEYNGRCTWISTAHPGTLFTPEAGQYPLFLKTAHFGFEADGAEVEIKVWSATGSTPGSVLASFGFLTQKWPTWTDVDLKSYKIVIADENFFVSSNGRGSSTFPTFRMATPRQYPSHHFTSTDDQTWKESYSDWAIECTVETNSDIGVAPASLGRVKALYF